eukprot:m.238112 g.238112  ORF g.238112 m.238112 type:complete len:337 (+) comp15284_c0_seq3:7437-8447(+)
MIWCAFAYWKFARGTIRATLSTDRIFHAIASTTQKRSFLAFGALKTQGIHAVDTSTAVVGAFIASVAGGADSINAAAIAPARGIRVAILAFRAFVADDALRPDAATNLAFAGRTFGTFSVTALLVVLQRCAVTSIGNWIVCRAGIHGITVPACLLGNASAICIAWVVVRVATRAQWTNVLPDAKASARCTGTLATNRGTAILAFFVLALISSPEFGATTFAICFTPTVVEALICTLANSTRLCAVVTSPFGRTVTFAVFTSIPASLVVNATPLGCCHHTTIATGRIRACINGWLLTNVIVSAGASAIACCVYSYGQLCKKHNSTDGNGSTHPHHCK